MSVNETTTKLDVLMFCLGKAGGYQQPVHVERIAKSAFDHKPDSFRWELEEFASYPDKEKVRRGLTSLEQVTTSRGSFVKSTRSKHTKSRAKKDYWQMTPKGFEWFLENELRITNDLNSPSIKLKDGESDYLITQITKSRLYGRYASQEDLPKQPYEFTDLLRCSPDASTEAIQRKYDSLRNKVRLLEDANVLEFLDACVSAYGSLLELV